MMDYFYTISDTADFFVLILLTVSFSVGLMVLHKFFIFHRLKNDDNVLTANVAQLIGIIYGVLIGFIWLYLIGLNDHASRSALNEGTSAANFYRATKWLKQPEQSEIQALLKEYITNVINVEWPEMSRAGDIHSGNMVVIDNISMKLKNYPIITKADEVTITNLLSELRTLYTARQDRILISQTELGPNIWIVILLGTALIILINYAFKVNFGLHLFGIVAFSLMAGSVLFLLVTLDRPFQGEFVVQPSALQEVLNHMHHDKI